MHIFQKYCQWLVPVVSVQFYPVKKVYFMFGGSFENKYKKMNEDFLTHFYN